MISRHYSDYFLLKICFLFFIIAISVMFISLSEKSESCIYNTLHNETSFSKSVSKNTFFSDCTFDLSDALPVHFIIDNDKNPLAGKKSFSYIRFFDNSRTDIVYISTYSSNHLNQFRSTVLLI